MVLPGFSKKEQNNNIINTPDAIYHLSSNISRIILKFDILHFHRNKIIKSLN